MPRRTVALALAVLLSLSGCTVHKVQQVPPANVTQPQPQNEKIVGITTMKGEDISFDKSGPGTIKDGKLSATLKKAPYEIPMDQVQRLWVDNE